MMFQRLVVSVFINISSGFPPFTWFFFCYGEEVVNLRFVLKLLHGKNNGKFWFKSMPTIVVFRLLDDIMLPHFHIIEFYPICCNSNAFLSNGLLKIWSYLSIHAFLSMNFLCVMFSCKFKRYSQDLAIHCYLAWWIVNLKYLGRLVS